MSKKTWLIEVFFPLYLDSIIISLLILKLVIKQESLNQSYEYFIKNDRVAGEKPFLNQGKKAESDEKPAGEGKESSISMCRKHIFSSFVVFKVNISIQFFNGILPSNLHD